jgi:hypothetical protein
MSPILHAGNKPSIFSPASLLTLEDRKRSKGTIMWLPRQIFRPDFCRRTRGNNATLPSGWQWDMALSMTRKPPPLWWKGKKRCSEYFSLEAMWEGVSRLFAWSDLWASASHRFNFHFRKGFQERISVRAHTGGEKTLMTAQPLFVLHKVPARRGQTTVKPRKF